MSDAEELAALRRLAELEAKSGNVSRETPPPAPDPSEGRLPFRPLGINTGLTMPQGVSRVMAGAGKAFTDIGRGAAQMLGADNQATIDESRRLDAPLMATGAGLGGNIAGNVAAALPTMAIPGANTMVGGAAVGGIMGGLQPVASDESRAQNVGMGAAGGAAVPALAGALRSAKSLVEPLYQRGREQIMGRLLNRVSGENAPAVQQRLASALELVPGSQPTAAEVAESGGMAALQRAVSGADPEAYATRAMQQASARAGQVRNIAGTPQDQRMAEAVREMMSGPLYEAAKTAKVPLTISDRKISEIMQRPSLEGAWQEAEKMAREAGVTSVTSKGEMTGETLHYLKMALDQKIADAKPGSPSQRLLMGTRDELRSWMEKKIPEYGQARKAFASWSPAVEQHEIGTQLANKLQPALTDYGALGNETAAQFARELRTTTGFGGRDISEIMSPSQMNVLENVGRDLGRKANAQNLGRGVGSDTMQKLSMANIAEQSGMPKLINFASNLPGVARATNWIYRDTDQQIREQLARALLDPRQSAMIMRQAQGNPQLAAALRQIQQLAIPAGAAGALTAQ